jgi:hypothetical protein
MSLEIELVRWLLLVAAAIALILAIATALAAGPVNEPRLLPDDMGSFAKPMTPGAVQPYFPETPPGRQLPPAEAAARLRSIFDDHRAGRALDAISGWEDLGLAEETAHWRQIAMGAAYLQLSDLQQAALHLEAARQRVPDHAVVAYFTGLLRLEQAAAAVRVPDGLPRRDLLVAYTPLEDKAMYQMAAIQELQMAIVRFADVRLDERLIDIDPLVEDATIAPTAGELLAAVGADNLVGKAHHLVFGVQLVRGELGEAEFHLDRAADSGIAVLYGYRDLAERYLGIGRNSAALRVLNKDLVRNHPWVEPVGKWLWQAVQSHGDAAWVW